MRHRGPRKVTVLTQEKLKQILSYDCDSGDFIRNRSWGNFKAGDVSGYITEAGYRRVGICGKDYFAHTLAWLYVYGEIPHREGMHIDHIDGDRLNNRISNLRYVSISKNLANSKIQKNNTSGVRGVSYHKRTRTWYAYIADRDNLTRQKMALGSYRCFDDAVAARRAAEIDLGWDGYQRISSARDFLEGCQNELR